MEIIEEKIVYCGRIFDLKVHKLKIPSDRVITREFVDHPGAVALIALKQGKILLIKQYRHSVRKWLFEVPAGTLERGESPEECAKRELEEETGYRAGRVEEVFKAYVAPGYSSELIHFFLAEDLRKGASSPEEDEITQTIWLDVDEALKMIFKGEIRDLKTISAILWISNVGGKVALKGHPPKR
jgi:ADP-ribose pyrophosphatase